MTANELRIGNIVIPKYASPDKDLFIEITAEEIYKMSGDVYFFEPIPLTEEWLLRLGFNEPINDWYWIGVDDCFIFGKKEDGWYLMDDYCMKPFKHVHQLQNLYFALTGEELTIKE